MSDDGVIAHLPSNPGAPALARRIVREHSVELSPALAEDALLIVDELVTNAVQHGQAEITLRLQRHDDGINVGVRDAGESFVPPGPGLPAPDRMGGRGLYMVAALASSWGITPHSGTGKTVWFELHEDGR